MLFLDSLANDGPMYLEIYGDKGSFQNITNNNLLSVTFLPFLIINPPTRQWNRPKSITMSV